MILYIHIGKPKQRIENMGYITEIDELDIADIDAKKLTPAKMKKFKEAMADDKVFAYWGEGIQKTLEFFLGYELDEEERVIRFNGYAAGKAYYLVEAVEKFANLLGTFGIVFSGSFVMNGEESGDIQKVLILDNKVEVKKAKITFE